MRRKALYIILWRLLIWDHNHQPTSNSHKFFIRRLPCFTPSFLVSKNIFLPLKNPWTANLKKILFLLTLPQFSFFSFFCHLFAKKMLKNLISTSVWSAKHPTAGQNIQHLAMVAIIQNWLNLLQKMWNHNFEWGGARMVPGWGASAILRFASRLQSKQGRKTSPWI